jgi:hypothetical protein
MLTGKITEKATGETLPNASIYITDQSGQYVPGTPGTASNLAGNYYLNANGSHLTASFTGLKSKTIAINGQTTINFELEAGNNTLPEVVITATRYWPRILAGLVIVAAIFYIFKK